MTDTHDLLARARKHGTAIGGTPLIDGDKATFVWEGEDAPALVGDFNLWGGETGSESTPLAQVAPGVWAATLTLPRDAYVEYFYTADARDPQSRIHDPFNRRKITNGMGKFNNWFDMPAVRHTPLVKAGAGVPRGTVTEHTLSHDLLPGARRAWLYRPPTDAAVPLLVVYDGKDYLKRARLPEIVDNLTAQGKIPPLALAFVDNARAWRFIEYHHGEAALLLVTLLLMPLARAHLNLLDPEKHPGAYGVLGASMGGLMALYTGLRLPHLFGRVLSQSGAFHFALPGAESLAHTLLRLLPAPAPLRIWQDVGALEWLLDSNRQMHTLLQERGCAVSYREYPGGHNYTSWRDQLPAALVATFGTDPTQGAG